MLFKFPGEKIVDGDIEKIPIEANALDEAIEIYNNKYPHLNYIEAVKKRYTKARKL